MVAYSALYFTFWIAREIVQRRKNPENLKIFLAFGNAKISDQRLHCSGVAVSAVPCFDVSLLIPRLTKYPQVIRMLKQKVKENGALNCYHTGAVAIALFSARQHEANEALFAAMNYRQPDTRLVDFVRALARRQARLDFAGAPQ